MSSATMSFLVFVLLVLRQQDLGALAQSDSDATCPAGDSSCGARDATASASGGQSRGKYHWPTQKGDLNRTGLSPYFAPHNLRAHAPAWQWQDPEPGVIRATPLIDDRLNIYLSTINGRVLKFSPDGSLLWTYRSTNGTQPAVPALMDGLLFGNTEKGWVYALDMENGIEVWAVQIANVTGGDTASLFAASGVVISATMVSLDAGKLSNNNALVALSSDGKHKWTHVMEGFEIYNFQGASPGDGTFVFMDSSGGLYRLTLETGKVLWESGIAERKAEWFTTAAAVVGPNDMVYCVSNYGEHGLVHAYRLADGEQVWKANVTLPAMQAVAVGQLSGSNGLSVVLGIGENPGFPIVLRMFHFSFVAFPWLFWMIAWTFGYLCFQGQRGRGKSRIKSCCCLVPLSALLLCCYVALMLVVHVVNLRVKSQPSWLFGVKPTPARIVALDAVTGAQRWSHELPPYERTSCAGDDEEIFSRLRALYPEATGHPICLPDSFSQAVISGDGTMYVGCQDGRLIALRDEDGNGQIAGEAEIFDYQFDHAFQASQALAPGMLAVVPCGGGLWMWKFK